MHAGGMPSELAHHTLEQPLHCTSTRSETALLETPTPATLQCCLQQALLSRQQKQLLSLASAHWTTATCFITAPLARGPFKPLHDGVHVQAR
jgi:hypothetical protein